MGEGSQARSTALGSGPNLAGVLGFESHPSHALFFRNVSSVLRPALRSSHRGKYNCTTNDIRLRGGRSSRQDRRCPYGAATGRHHCGGKVAGVMRVKGPIALSLQNIEGTEYRQRDTIVS